MVSQITLISVAAKSASLSDLCCTNVEQPWRQKSPVRCLWLKSWDGVFWITNTTQPCACGAVKSNTLHGSTCHSVRAFLRNTAVASSSGVTQTGTMCPLARGTTCNVGVRRADTHFFVPEKIKRQNLEKKSRDVCMISTKKHVLPTSLSSPIGTRTAQAIIGLPTALSWCAVCRGSRQHRQLFLDTRAGKGINITCQLDVPQIHPPWAQGRPGRRG